MDMDLEQKAIMRLREAADTSERFYKAPLIVTTSGGKDSSVCVALAEKAGIDFEVMHNHTTVDAPETVYFIRREFKRLEEKGVKCTVNYPYYKGERVTMWSLIPQKLMPPTRLARYCCSILKERGGQGRYITTGVRWAESAARKKRGIFENIHSNPEKRVILNNDNDDRRRLFETCMRQHKAVCNPIIDWSDADVWDYIESEKIPVNPLYECGFSRVGCVGCPTTVYPWTLSLTVPADTLKSEIRYAKNMTNIKKTTDATSIANRVYALGYGEGVNQLTIEAVNGGVPYVEDALSIERYGLCSTILVDSRYQVAENLKAYAEQILAGLKEPYISYEIGAIDLHRLTGDSFSKFRPGEVVRVVDEADGINLRTRIVRVEKSDAEGDPGSVTVTIANKTQDIAGSISDLQSRALISETYAQGATNQQIYNFSDNADATHPAKLQLYISDSVVRINKMLLNIEFEAFRAYEKAIGGGGGQTTSGGGGQTTSSGGGSTTSAGGGQTTSSGGGQTSSATALESSNVLPSQTSGQAVHNHGLPSGAHLAICNASLEVVGYADWVPSGAHTHPAHTHKLSAHTHEVDDHTHTVSAHTHTVSNHTHTVQDHTHAIEFGIYEGQRASKATIKVDGKEIPAPSSYSDIDIVEYLEMDTSGKIRRNAWHTIEILPDTMSRIVGAVFAQTFCNSRGGGDY